MNPSNADPDSWAASVADYLRDHPHASDSAEGIARWWLGAPVAEWPRIRQALKSMVSDGRLECHVASDGREHYRRAAASGTSAP